MNILENPTMASLIDAIKKNQNKAAELTAFLQTEGKKKGKTWSKLYDVILDRTVTDSQRAAWFTQWTKVVMGEETTFSLDDVVPVVVATPPPPPPPPPTPVPVVVEPTPPLTPPTTDESEESEGVTSDDGDDYGTCKPEPQPTEPTGIKVVVASENKDATDKDWHTNHINASLVKALESFVHSVQVPVIEQKPAPTIDLSEYVKRTEVEEIVRNAVKQILKQIL